MTSAQRTREPVQRDMPLQRRKYTHTTAISKYTYFSDRGKPVFLRYLYELGQSFFFGTSLYRLGASLI